MFPRFWTPLYHDIGLPLGAELPPVPGKPEDQGETSLVSWAVRGNRARFWARPGERRVPIGLHGVVRFRETPQGTTLRVLWSPPWTLGLALVWGALLATERGDGAVMVPVFTILGAVLTLLYGWQARRVALELRLAFTRSPKPDAAPDRE